MVFVNLEKIIKIVLWNVISLLKFFLILYGITPKKIFKFATYFTQYLWGNFADT